MRGIFWLCFSSSLGHNSLNFWTLEQYSTFIQYVRDIRIHTAFQVLFYSGMRCGEMLALTLADFDFKVNTINVSKTLYRNRTGAPNHLTLSQLTILKVRRTFTHKISLM
ncbi:hypothetical protein D7V82_20845 [bacterium 1xD8-6]|nr:hypothetical protein D7V72_20945 [bacterium D16-36]RKI63220.1 hypothetical protein D7V82_20845 [bacterium 1xD8-6]